MAIVTKNPSGLKLRFELERDEVTQKVKVKTKTYSNVKPSATNDDVHVVGQALASLHDYNLLEVAKIDNTTLSA